MPLKVFDELPESIREPPPEHVDFFLMISLQLGDPQTSSWVSSNAVRFHELVMQAFGWRKHDPRSGELLLAYIIWYDLNQKT